MALQIRRGLEADLPASPADGELLYATDTNKLFIGDSGIAQIISGGLTNVVEDSTPQLGGNLDLNGYKIVTSSNGNIEIDPDGAGNIILHGNLTISSSGNITKSGQLNISPTTLTSFGNDTTLVDGNVTITRNSYSATQGAGFVFSQHHETSDAVNFTFYRSRGTGATPTAIANGDDIVDISFVAHDGTSILGAGNIACQADGPVSTGLVPGRFRFALHDGVTSGAIGLRAVAELSAAGVWKVNSIQNFSGTDLTVTATNIRLAGNVQLNSQADLRFADSDSSNWVAFQAPATIASNVLWTLPAADGSTGQVLTTNGSGLLSWSTGTGLPSRIALPTVTTSLLNEGEFEAVTLNGFKGYVLYKIQTNVAARVRLYTSIEAKDADVTRPEGTPALQGSGLVAEVITTGATAVLIAPGAFGFSSESVPSSLIPCTVTNKSGTPALISVTATVLQLEI